jgi:DnaJ-class molecular chaperone
MEEKDEVSEGIFILCHDCDGSGYLRNYEGHSYTCPSCKGKGEKEIKIKKDDKPKTI